MNGAQGPAQTPTAVYSPQPLVVGPDQALSPVQGHGQPIVVIQQAPPPQSWLKEHQGQLIAGTAAAFLGIGLLLALAIVAVAVAIGGAVSYALIKLIVGESKN